MRDSHDSRVAAMAWVVWAAILLPACAEAASSSLVLDQTAYWRRHYVFGADPVITPQKAGHRGFVPYQAPMPPDNWTAADFDDGVWTLLRRPFQGGSQARFTTLNLGQYDESVDMRLQVGCYRARFVVEDPQKAESLSLKLSYHGGARVFVNGTEVGRGNLPAGNLDANARAEGYPPEAYPKEGEKLRERSLGPVKIDAKLLKKGVNVVAVEIRASPIHAIVAKNPTQPNWGGPMRPWPHAFLAKIELSPSSAAVPSVLKRPAGAQVWAVDANYRMDSTDFLPPGEPPGVVRLVGVRNGTFAGQIAVGTDKALAGLDVQVRPLARAGGSEKLDASVVQILGIAPFPVDEWTLAKLGDERGLAAAFPSQSDLAKFAAMGDSSKTYLFDQLVPAAPKTVPANACRPLWLSVKVPANAAPGKYAGSVEVKASGLEPVLLPVEIEVLDWALPDPKDFQTWVGCEENPYGVAKQYGVKLWSDAHLKLLAASFKQLARIGNGWLNVPVIGHTEFGNKDDSPIAWKGAAKSPSFDYAVLDKYLDVAMKDGRPPRVVQFTVEQGMAMIDWKTKEKTPGAEVKAGGTAIPLPSSESGAWQAFAKSLYDHMKSKKLEKAVWWGYPLEGEADPGLKDVLAAAASDVFWIAGPHEMMYNGTFCKNEKFYRLVADIRYQGGWPAFRDDQGWRNTKTIHLVNPRVGGCCHALHTTSHPFAYRILPNQAIARGMNGFTRLGADEWAGVHYEGMKTATWQTGIPVLFLFWPGANGAESSVRFETLLEGVQEAEARIFVEQALDKGRLSPDVAAKAKQVLADHFQQTCFVQGNSIIYSMEQYSYGWQERSRRLYEIAAEAAKAK